MSSADRQKHEFGADVICRCAHIVLPTTRPGKGRQNRARAWTQHARPANTFPAARCSACAVARQICRCAHTHLGKLSRQKTAKTARTRQKVRQKNLTQRQTCRQLHTVVLGDNRADEVGGRRRKHQLSFLQEGHREQIDAVFGACILT